MSFVEALVNSIVGLCVAVLLTRYALPFWGYTPSIADYFEITALFFAAGFVRNWFIRAVFHRFGQAATIAQLKGLSMFKSSEDSA